MKFQWTSVAWSQVGISKVCACVCVCVRTRPFNHFTPPGLTSELEPPFEDTATVGESMGKCGTLVARNYTVARRFWRVLGPYNRTTVPQTFYPTIPANWSLVEFADNIVLLSSQKRHSDFSAVCDRGLLHTGCVTYCVPAWGVGEWCSVTYTLGWRDATKLNFQLCLCVCPVQMYTALGFGWGPRCGSRTWVASMAQALAKAQCETDVRPGCHSPLFFWWVKFAEGDYSVSQGSHPVLRVWWIKIVEDGGVLYVLKTFSPGRQSWSGSLFIFFRKHFEEEISNSDISCLDTTTGSEGHVTEQENTRATRRWVHSATGSTCFVKYRDATHDGRTQCAPALPLTLWCMQCEWAPLYPIVTLPFTAVIEPSAFTHQLSLVPFVQSSSCSKFVALYWDNTWGKTGDPGGGGMGYLPPTFPRHKTCSLLLFLSFCSLSQVSAPRVQRPWISPSCFSKGCSGNGYQRNRDLSLVWLATGVGNGQRAWGPTGILSYHQLLKYHQQRDPSCPSLNCCVYVHCAGCRIIPFLSEKGWPMEISTRISGEEHFRESLSPDQNSGSEGFWDEFGLRSGLLQQLTVGSKLPNSEAKLNWLVWSFTNVPQLRDRWHIDTIWSAVIGSHSRCGFKCKQSALLCPTGSDPTRAV